MQLLDASGNPPRQSAPHDPEQVQKERMLHSMNLKRVKEGYMADMNPDPQGATTPNAEAVKAYWIAEWEKYTNAVSKSRLPILLNMNAFQEWLAAEEANAAKEERLRTPLHQLDGLEQFEFKLVGDGHFGKVWLNSHFALTVASNGEVRVYFIRDERAVLRDIEQQLVLPLVTAINYTLANLRGLMAGLRISVVTWPLDGQLDEFTRG